MAVVVKDDESTGAGRGSSPGRAVASQAELLKEGGTHLACLLLALSHSRLYVTPQAIRFIARRVLQLGRAGDKFGYGSTSSALMQSIIYLANRLYVARIEDYAYWQAITRTPMSLNAVGYYQCERSPAYPQPALDTGTAYVDLSTLFTAHDPA